MSDRLIWTGCYDRQWSGFLPEEAMRHPAKMAMNLVTRIFAHARDRGWILAGDDVVDPFGGVGTTALVGALEGYNVACCELEKRWADAATGYWCDGFGANGLVPPRSREDACPDCRTMSEDFSFARPHRFAGTFDYLKLARTAFGRTGDATMICGDSRYLSVRFPPKHFRLLVSSPPYGSHNNRAGQPKAGWKHTRFLDNDAAIGDRDKRYGGSTGQIAAERFGPLDLAKPSGFWESALDVLKETHKVLAPGAVACWVVKDFVQAGRRQRFSDWWIEASESVGFALIERANAMLVNVVKEPLLFGGVEKVRKGGRKTALKRAHDKRLPEEDERWIDHEDVIFLRRI